MTVRQSEAQSTITGLLRYVHLNQLFRSGLDLLFPPRCAGCGRVDTSWCHICQLELQNTPVTSHERWIGERILTLSTGVHKGKLQSAIHALKYDAQTHLGDPLGQRMLIVLSQKDWRIDTIVPVPLHTSRLQQRGYNQSQILGEKIAEAFSIPCEPMAIIRQRETQSQVGLSQTERQVNMVDAFKSSPELVSGKVLLIIDDVLTTGATLSACAQSALSAGASQVYGLTVTVAGDS